MVVVLDARSRLRDNLLLDYTSSNGARGFILLLQALLIVLFLQVSEDIVEDEISIGLFGEEESLGEFPPRLVVVGHFANGLNNDAIVGRGLSVDRVDVDFAVLEANGQDLLVDLVLTITRLTVLALSAVNKCRVLCVEAV